MKILVTGGAGYIGSHTCLELLEAGHEVVVVDNLINSSEESLRRVQKLTGKSLTFHRVDLLDKDALEAVFEQHDFEVVIHFAGLKAVGESVEQPRRYYYNNVMGSLVLVEVMSERGVKDIVFSSSATVYREPEDGGLTEEAPVGPSNPYGRSKLMIEDILRDVQAADERWNVALLRYFNPVGAHASGEIGEDPAGIPNNLVPYIAQVAVGKLKELPIYGNDYATPDGTGVRDYIHVIDLARGHIRALEKLKENPGVVVYNLGTGKGVSVLEMVAAFERASGVKIPCKVQGRRSGDLAIVYADPSKANRELDWVAKKGIEEMCADVWRWQSQNPNGYDGNR